MKLQVRQGLFETNSSSVHSLTMCTLKDYSDFKNGHRYYDTWDKKLVPKEDVVYEDDKYEHRYLTYSEYEEEISADYETYAEFFKTPSGDMIIAFGYYGNE